MLDPSLALRLRLRLWATSGEDSSQMSKSRARAVKAARALFLSNTANRLEFCPQRSRPRKVSQPITRCRDSRLRCDWQRDRDARAHGRFQRVVIRSGRFETVCHLAVEKTEF
jgi:hypothetical protein